MAEQSGQVRVRVVVRAFSSELEHVINDVLKEELTNGAEVVDIKLTSTAPPSGQPHIGSSFGEHVALIILRSVSAIS